jgi:prepilin-type N-terminal cleavage/methylation domain-containing protein
MLPPDSKSTKPALRVGFTLIEMSIVLVIIGLIVGGLLVGRDLIKAAELRSIITDVEKFNAAVSTFRGKYDCLPGDCANATTFLAPGDTSNCPINNPLNPGTTCNGNGDSMIGGRVTNMFEASMAHSEYALLWQHLALAGLIPGSYKGDVGIGGSTSSNESLSWLGPQTSFSSPTSRVASACYDIAYGWPNDPGMVNVLWPVTIPGHYVHFGSSIELWNPCGGGYCLTTCDQGAITPSQAYSLDKKLDDGIPYSGNVVNNNIGSTSCVNDPSGQWTQGAGSQIAYNLSLSTAVCGLGFKAQGF